jgi:hypothetical protein
MVFAVYSSNFLYRWHGIIALRLPFTATLPGDFSRRRCHNSNKTSTHIHDIFYFRWKHSFVQTVLSLISCILSIRNVATMGAALLQAVAQDKSNVITVRFNNRRYGSWQAARDAFNQLKNKKGGNSVLSKLTLVPDDESPFKLRCFSCGNSCQLCNPLK